MMLDVSDFVSANESHHADNYLRMLGFVDTNNKPKATNYMFCTILGELFNMPGHYVVVGNNKVISGLHSDIFYIERDEFEEYYKEN